MKKLSLVLSLVLFAVGFAIAQRTVTGTVTDDGGEALIGASILVKGTSSGTVTDIDGTYSITVPDGANTLIVSYTGFETREVVVGASNVLDISMSEGIALDEVVVTAIGVERKKDNDLSSATLIKSDAVTRSGETGVIQGLSGKTSGLTITRNSGDPGSGAYIQIRGQNTVLGDASPLIIIDGVPMSNTSTTAGRSSVGGVNAMSRLNDINPQDIESITVLKGASAAAVYGTGAANGVIVIKTKSGKTAGRRFKINVNTSYAVDQINREFEKQDQFGQGFPAYFATGEYDPTDYGQFVPNTGFSWGDRIADRSGGADEVNTAGEYFTGNQTGTVYYPIVSKNSREVYNDKNRDQVFQDGQTLDMSASIAYTGDNSTTFFSFARLSQEGIIRGNSSYDRNNFRINHSVDLLDNLSVRLNGAYTNSEAQFIQKGSNLAGLYLGYIRTSPDFDNTDYDGIYTSASGLSREGHRGYRRYLGNAAPTYNNPGWTINRQRNPSEVDRVMLTPEITWKALPGLNLTARYGVDFYTDDRITFFPVNSAGDFALGYYGRDVIREKTQNLFLIADGAATLSDKMNLGYTFGYNLYDNTYARNSGEVNNFLVNTDKEIFANSTADNQSPSQFLSQNRKNGVFSVLNFDYANKLFLELSGRAERTVTVPDELFFYPSASIGYKIAENPSAGFSFGKLRLSYGQVGIEPTLYANKNLFGATTSGSEGWGDYLDGVNYGGTYALGSTAGNPNLTIEKVSELEFGGDFRFFANRLSLGLTYYDRTTTDAILPVELPASTGFTDSYQNAAEISNKGVEIDFGYNVLSNSNMNWRVFGNFTSNKNVVTSLPGVSRYILGGFTSTSSAVVEGAPFAAIFGGRFLRDDNGDLMLDENGFPQADPTQGVIGDPNLSGVEV
ncbi:MAG: SusC/RagA family TonB-linked outer membrane protein [Saprospiraceae bacterium]